MLKNQKDLVIVKRVSNSDEVKLYLNDLFSDRLNILSIKEGYMNSNYPSKLLPTDDNILQDCYISSCDDRLKIYTCGFSKIIGSV